MNIMSKLNLKILTLAILAVCLTLFAVACGGGEPSLPTSAPTKTAGPPTAAPTAQPHIPTSTPSAGDHLEKGEAYFEQGEWDKALVEYKTAIELEPDNPYAHRDLGSVYNRQSNWEEAVAAYKQAIKLAPDFGEVYGDLVGAYNSTGNSAEAISAGEKAITLAPDYAVGHNNLGVTYSLVGRHDEAVTEYREAIRLDPDFAMPHYNLGLLKKNQDQIDQAVTEFQESIRLDPDYALAHYQLGVIHYKQVEMDQAVVDWEEAARLDPDFPTTHRNLGIVYSQQERAVEALAEFGLYLQLAPDAPDRAAVEDDIAKLTARIEASSEESETDVKTYDNKYLGLNMQYPADWVLRDSISDVGAVIVLGSNADFATISDPAIFTQLGASIQISMKDLGQFSATNLVDLQAEFIKDVYPPMTPINDLASISVPGDLGNAVVGIDGGYIAELDNGQTLRFGITTLVQSGRAIVMVAIWGEDYEAQVLSGIQALLSSVDWKLTAPELLMNVIFTAAQKEDYSILSVLCHPDVDNNSDTQAICDIATASPASQAEFVNYFKNGKVTGMAHFNADGTQAQVPFLFGPNGDQEETMTFILHNNEWYLYGF